MTNVNLSLFKVGFISLLVDNFTQKHVRLFMAYTKPPPCTIDCIKVSWRSWVHKFVCKWRMYEGCRNWPRVNTVSGGGVIHLPGWLMTRYSPRGLSKVCVRSKNLYYHANSDMKERYEVIHGVLISSNNTLVFSAETLKTS